MFNLGRLVSSISVAFMATLAQAGPASFTYQGRIMSSSGSPLEHHAVSFEFTVLNPNGSCVIYKELVTGVDMRNSQGLFEVIVGEGTKTYPTTPGFSLVDAFNNASLLNCDGSATYTPGVSHGRVLRVQFYDGVGWRLITPDSEIHAVPYASFANQALKLESYSASAFVLKDQVNSGANCSGGSFLTWDAAAKSFGCAAAPTGGSSGPVDLTSDVTGILPIASGGTGAGTQGAALNNLLPSQTGHNGKVLQTNGASASWVTPSAATIADDSVTSAKIDDGSIEVADLNMAGAMLANLGLLVHDGTQFHNKTCGGNEVLVWSVPNGWVCTPFSIDTAQLEDGAVTGDKLETLTGLTAGTYGSATHVPAITVDVKGRITAITTNAVSAGSTLPSQTSQAGKFLQTNGSVLSWETITDTDTGMTALTGDVTASGSGSQVATIAANAVTSAKISDGTIETADLKFVGTMATNTGVIVRDATQFHNLACTTAGHVLTWSATGWICDAPAGGTETDPQVGTNTQNYISKWSGTELVSSGIIEVTGNIGIGAAVPSEKLHVSGNIMADSYIQTSDRRLKRNITSIDGLSLVRQLRGVKYQRIASGKDEYGLIAQEVEAVAPEFVVTRNDGIKAVHYQNLVSPLIEAVKEVDLQCRADSAQMRNEISALKSELATTRAELQEMKKMIRELASEKR